MKDAIGCDEIAIGLKNSLIEVLEEKGIEYEDFGVYDEIPIDYPDKAAEVAKAV